MNNTSNNDSPKGCIIVFVTIFVLAFLGWGITTLIQSNSNPYKNRECEWNNCGEEATSRLRKPDSEFFYYYCDKHFDEAKAYREEMEEKYKDEYNFSDYLKDEAPDLYNDIKDRYDSLTD